MRRAASPRLWPLCLLAFIRGAGSIDCFRDNFLRKDQDTILHKRCRTLDFSVSPKTFGVVGPAEMKKLSKALRRNDSKIWRINLRNNRMGTDGAKHLARALKNDSLIEILDVRENRLQALSKKEGWERKLELLKREEEEAEIRRANEKREADEKRKEEKRRRDAEFEAELRDEL